MPILGTGLAMVLSGGLRSIAGWAENSFKDGKIDAIEWTQLGATVLRVGAMTLAISLGMESGLVQSASIAVVLDYILLAIKKKK